MATTDSPHLLTGPLRFPFQVAAVAFGYYITAVVGLDLSFKPDIIGALWPPNALVLTALLLSPRRRWPWFLLVVIPAELLADLPFGVSLLQALAFVGADILEVLVAAVLLRTFLGGPPAFSSLRHIGFFLLCAVVVAPFLSAFPGATLPLIDGTSTSFGSRWLLWFLGDGLTHLTITSFLLVWLTRQFDRRTWNNRWRWVEGAALVLTFCGVAYVLLGSDAITSGAFPSLLYIMLPVLLWSAIRFGPRGTCTAGLLVALLGIWSTSRGWGPFATGSATMDVLNLQFFLLLSLSPMLILAVLMEERRRSERTIRESEEKYRLLVENQTDLIVKMDLQGRLLFVSPSYCRMFGRNEAALLGRPFLDQVHQEDRPAACRALEEVLRPPHTSYAEQRALAGTGWRWLAWVKTAVFDRHGRATAIIGVGRDITQNRQTQKEKEKLQEKLNRAKKMEALGLLAGGVAHDLNNILSGLVTLPDFLLLEMPEQDPLRPSLETIREAGHRAAAVVQDLLTLSRGIAVTKKPTDLNRLVAEYLDSPEHRKLAADYPAVTLNTSLEADVPTVTGSAVHLKKTVLNLVTNAAEAVEGNGTIFIETAYREIDEPLAAYESIPGGQYVVLSVADDGPGIHPLELERIFEPFYSRKVLGRSGTGLGLTVVWNTVHDHGGFVHLSTDKNGSRFDLFFPATHEAVPADLPAPAMDRYRGAGQSILVVDDERLQRDIAVEMLNGLNYRATAVASGEAAVEHVTRTPVDLLLLDMIMPAGLDGRETFQRIRAIWPDQKVIIVSGFSATEDVQSTLDMGAGPFLRKPYRLDELAMAIHDVLAHDRR